MVAVGMVAAGMVGVVDTSVEEVRTSAAEGLILVVHGWEDMAVHGWEAMAVIEAERWLRPGVLAE
jgi:hypothetical protein